MNNITTKESIRTGSELSVGQYVKYAPSGGSTSYSSTQAHNGNGDQTISRESLNWRVLSVSGNTVKIISDPTTKTVWYSGAEGYNNAVKDLNDMCETLYSHGTTKARSVNLDDFITSSFKNNFKQDDLSFSIGATDIQFPAIYQYERDGSLGQSYQARWYSGTYTNRAGVTNDWSGNIPGTSPLYSSYPTFWLSSRCIHYNPRDEDSSYMVRLQSASYRLDTARLYMPETSGDTGTSKPIRAVITLPTSCTFGTETGDQSSPITIYW